MHKRLTFSWVVLGGLLLSGCVKDKSALSNIKDWLMEFPNPFVSNTDDPILAQADNITIRASEYKQFFQQYKLRGLANLSEADRRRLLDGLLRQKIMVKLAKNSGIFQDPDYQNMTREMLISMFTKRMPVTDKEMRDYYKVHLKEFTLPDPMISHVLLKSPAQARKAYTALVKGLSFHGLKREKLSSLQSHPDSSLEKAALALKIGAVSHPIKTRAGFEVIRRDPPSSLPFEAVQEQIHKRLQAEKLANLSNQSLSSTKVEIDDRQLNALVLE